MYETLLEELLQTDAYTKNIYAGVFARDELPEKVAYPSCLIVNTKPRHHTGEHWLAIYYDLKGHANFFDSYGNPPSYFKLESFLENTSKSWSYNNIRVQGYSSFCGYYSLLYLLERSRNRSNNFFSYFDKNYQLNDFKINYYLNLFKSNKIINKNS